MCDICNDVVSILESHDERLHANDGLQLTASEIFAVVDYVAVWPQRQCMCIYKDFKNFERLNNVVQIILTVGIRQVFTLPEDIEREIKKEQEAEAEADEEKNESEEEKKTESCSEDFGVEISNINDKERLLNFMTKVFLMNFPSYIAYKHIVHSSLEELSQQETSALNNFCEISDPEVPLYLLRNVCFFCDSNGIASLNHCFEKATSETLPFNFAHILITIIANLRLWMNIPTVMQCIIPLRSAVIRYMCQLPDKDLRVAGNRNMTELLWAAVKDPIETHFTFDKEGLDLAFKYFTCSTLTLRLAGITQINNQINMYNESCNNENLADAEKIGSMLSQWLLENKIVDHIFGPNLHVELIKQSQIILNFLAVEGKITNEHLDSVWATSQLKHCGKQVYDILIPLIKNLELQPVQHLLKLVSSLEPSAHTESTLYLVSSLIKCVWNTFAVSQSYQVSSLPSSYSGTGKEEEIDTAGMGKPGNHEMSSSEHSQLSNREVSGEQEKAEPGTSKEDEIKPNVEAHPNREVESSVDAESDVSHASEETQRSDMSEVEEHETHCGCHQKHHASEVRLHQSRSSDSDLDCSDTGDSDVSGYIAHKRQVLAKRHLKQNLTKGHNISSALHHPRHHHHHRQHHPNIEVSSSEEEVEEEEEEEFNLGYMDSEDEEIIRQAHLVHMKHVCEKDSEESSELDDETHEKLLHEAKLQYEARQALQQHHQNQHHEQLIQHAAHLLLRRQRNQQRFEKKQRLKQHKTRLNSEDKDDNHEKQMDTSGESSQLHLAELAHSSQDSHDSDTAVVSIPVQEMGLSERALKHSHKVDDLHKETEIFDCTPYIKQMPSKKRREASEYMEDIMSPDDGSYHSSGISAKSEKNMADFEGEELLSDEEIAQINAHSHFNSKQMQQHLSSMASMYHTHLPRAVIHHRPSQKEAKLSTSEFTSEDVCRKGNTLLWDLVQEDCAQSLPDGLAVEAEKALCTLVCFSTEKRIKIKFIEACVENVANHRSVVISLRLLPRIFGSFQQYRSGTDTHTVTMWADNELHMMKHFFDDLIHYKENVKGHKQNPLYCHREEIQVRLQFLTCIFSSMGSPDSFRLSLEQVDVLWNCLANDDECSDECLNWFLNQAKSKDHHALGLEAFKHVFLEKMPQLHPKSMSMVGLNLFQQLSHLARIANASSEEPLSEDKVYGIDQMWNIALRSLNTDVSLNAIQYLNFYYINYGNGLLEKEKEFVQLCMDNLLSASTDIEDNSECHLLVIQRGLILLKTHLESFKKRYAYQLRNWQIEGKGIISHQRNQQEKQSQPIRVLLQPAGMPEKTPLEMMSTDLIAELRAEVARWWETLQKQQQEQTSQAEGHGGAMLSPILGAMLGDGPIRMITLGQELSVDMDEKTLNEMQFKDMQLIFVSVGASRPPRKMDGTLPSSHLPTISPEKVPMMLLLQQPHFDRLFNLLEQLSNACFQTKDMDSQKLAEIQTKSRVLSRKVWELLMILPTNPEMLQGFKNILSKEENIDKSATHWNKLLDLISPHRLMYSLQIVEALSRTPQYGRRSLMHSGGGDSIHSATESELLEGDSSPEEAWNKKFITSGGLKHMLDIFKSERLQNEEGKIWSQWNQECLAYLLRLISQFSVSHNTDSGQDDVFESLESPRKKIKRTKSSHEKIVIPRLNPSTLDMLNPDSDLSVLMQILYNAAMPCDSNQVYTGSWGRAEVVHYAMSFLVSWAHSCEAVQQSLCQRPNFSSWLKRLLLEAPEPHVRKEVCMGLYRLCLGKSSDSKIGYGFLMPLLSSMLSFLSDAMLVKPPKNSDLEVIKEKEPYGPGCKDYFWLACRFVESISKEDAKPDSGSLVNLDMLARELRDNIVKREFLETRLGGEEDSCLIGLLNLFTATIKYNPSFKVSREGQEFLEDVFQYLFALPSPNQRYLPKCKNHSSRSAAYDLLVEMVKGSVDNYFILLSKMLQQHTKDAHVPYPWDYWPHEDGRSKCGFVGLTNLGATCYMATCMQHLYMLPQVRESVLQAHAGGVVKVPMIDAKHEGTLTELQKMFAYFQESERKAYNPKSFCKVYTMDKQPLNTGEQKDMTEFFTDLITKMEEMSPAMKKLVKTQFGGIISNNVVSLDCPHVSRTVEEFYTVRCQVTDMKNLYESLDEVTVKDMLEGDNMYTCSKCQKKVRAEKRACFRKLPRILCFNTMRYTFNMVTMMKEKVNTHFSFPLLLDMTHYMEKNLMGPDKLQDEDLISEDTADDVYEYELIGVTVHTGTADGGHYYSFIRDRINSTENEQDKWYLFNDAEIKPFDPSQIALECFGGEMTSKTYDSVTDKFMDFSFEKTNSAYMLFYERCLNKRNDDQSELSIPEKKFNFDLDAELAEWIWADNMQFLQDKNIFEHTYFGFMWQICAFIPQTLPKGENSLVPLKAAQLSTSFVLETLIHSKEKPTMLQWIELLTKLFNTCPQACEWFLDHMAETDWWPQQILIKCPNQMVRQMFHRLSIHVITQLRPDHVGRYLQPIIETEDGEVDTAEMGTKSCVTRFIRKLLSVLEHGVRPHSKYLTEYFAFLLDFAKMGDDECFFLIQINAISTMINFYMGQKTQENYVEILSDEDEEEEEVITLTDDAYKPLSLEKMIALIALLVEKARGEDNNLQLSERDYHAIIGGKGFPFLFSQLRDSINVRQSCNLIFSLSRWNDDLALAMVQMVFTAIKKLSLEQSQPFFKLLTMLLEFVGGPPGMPPFTQYVLQKFWELAKNCPQPCLEWLSTQVTRNKLASAWVLSQADNWVEQYLIANSNSRVRNAAAYLLVSLVPSPHFRQSFRTTRILSPQKDIQVSPEALSVLHKIYEHLLSLLPRTRLYVDPHTHGTMKLTCYFCLMTYCLISKTEKLMFSPHFLELWQVFQPKLSEPQISTHHNKQALLLFWYHVCLDCPENVKLIVNNPHVCKNIGFIYILADHEDQDVVMFNRCMLPSYYGLLRMCCQQSRSFTRQLAQHQNVQWAFKNISPYPAQYTAAVEELFRMMKLMATIYEDSSEDEIKAVNSFKRNTIQLYLNCLDARSMWQTLISALKILIDNDQDRILLLCQQGLQMLTEAFHTLHVMYHEATACHVTGDIVDLLTLLQPTLKTARYVTEKKGTAASEIRNNISNWKERMELVKKLLTLLNSYTPPEIRKVAIEVLREMLLIFQSECVSTMVPILVQSHMTFQEANMPINTGPFFPRRGQKPFGSKSNIRPPRPQFQMFLHSSQIEAGRGVDDNYDASLSDFFMQYHGLVDLICRVAANNQNLNEQVVNLSAMVAYEGVPLHVPYFAKLWYEIYQSEQVDKNCIRILCESSFFIDYVDAVLLDERSSLNNHVIYQFFCNYFPKVHQQVLNDQGRSLLDSLIASIVAERSALENVRFAKEIETVCQRLNGDLRAMLLIFSVQLPKQISPVLLDSLQFILDVCQQYQKEKADAENEMQQQSQSATEQEQSSQSETKTASQDNTEEEKKGEQVPSKKRKLQSDTEENEASKSETEGEQSVSSSSVSKAETEPQPSTSQQPDTIIRSNRASKTKDKNSAIDHVSKNIDCLFSLIIKK